MPATITESPMNFCRLIFSLRTILLSAATKIYSSAAKIGPSESGTSL